MSEKPEEREEVEENEDSQPKNEPQGLMAKYPNAVIFAVVFLLLGTVIGIQVCR